MKDITIDNNVFDGCGTNSFWQPACVWFGGYREVGDHNLSFDKGRGHQSQYELNLMKVFAMNH